MRIFFDRVFYLLFAKRVYSIVSIAILFSIPLILFYDNFEKTNLSETEIGNNLARDILTPLPKNSIVFPHTDTITFNIWYGHYVLGVRPDVEIINIPGAGGNSFKKYRVKDKNSRSSKGILLEFNEEVPVFFTYEANFGSDDLISVPKGLLFEVINKKDIPEKEIYREEITRVLAILHIPSKNELLPSEKNLITPEITTFYSNALLQIGNFFHFHYEDPKSALMYYKKASEVDHENYAAYANLSVSQYKAFKDCKNSIKNIQNALKYYPVSKGYYAIWYIIQMRCDKRYAHAIKSEYRLRFHKDIDIEVEKQLKTFNL